MKRELLDLLYKELMECKEQKEHFNLKMGDEIQKGQEYLYEQYATWSVHFEVLEDKFDKIINLIINE